MRKAFLFSGLTITALILFVLGSITYVLIDIDTFIKNNIESIASRAFKVPVTVAEATMSLKSGDGQIVGLSIPNPPGFDTSEAIHLPLTLMQIDTGRIAAHSIKLQRVVIDSPRIVLELKDGRANLMRLKASTQAWVTRSLNAGEEASKGQRLTIQEVILQNGILIFRADFLGDLATEIPLPDSRVTRIGHKTDGALTAEVIQTVMQLMVTAAERATRRIDLKELAEKNNKVAPDIDLSAILKE